MAKKSVYIKFMKAMGYITTPELQCSDVEIWDTDFSESKGYLYFQKLKTPKSKKKKL